MECKDIPFILNNQGLNKKNKKPGPGKGRGSHSGRGALQPEHKDQVARHNENPGPRNDEHPF